jgi:alpha-L-arabinofuranosidase
MANLAQLVNAIAPVVTTADAAAVQPIYYPFLLHAQAALDLAADVHVDGPVISPELPDGASRWPHRVADLGPFSLVDAAASVSADRGRIAVTLVNRGLEAVAARLVLRDFTFAGAAAVTVLTADNGPLPEPGSARVPGIASVRLAEGTERANGPALALTLPPQSFTVIEAPVAASP